MTQLTPAQKQIYDKLSSINEAVAQAYRGALYALEQNENPDKIAQSAHSVREMSRLLAKQGETPTVTDDALNLSDEDKDEIFKVRLKSAMDPNSKAHSKFDIYKTWNDMHRRFTGIAHHGKPPISEEKYRELLLSLETLLMNFVFGSQLASRGELDSIIQAGPDKVEWKSLKQRLSKTLEEDRYFFKHADETWLEPLIQRGYFKKCPEVVQEDNSITIVGYPESEYLARMAPSQPNRVMEVILNISMGTSDSPLNLNAAVNIVDAALKMPADVAKNVVEKVKREKWIKRSYHHSMLLYRLLDLLEMLIHSKQLVEADKLSKLLLCVNEKVQLFSDGEKQYSASVPIKNLIKPLPNAFNQIEAKELGPFIRQLVVALCQIVEIEIKNQLPSDNKPVDFSSRWRPAIEDHEQNLNNNDLKESLVQTIRDLSERYLPSYMSSSGNLTEELDTLFKCRNQFPIARRLQLHFYRLYPEACAGEIENAVLTELDNYDCWHEFALLVGEHFANFNEQTKQGYVNKVKAGPVSNTGPNDASYVRDWKRRRLGIIKDHLAPEDKQLYETLSAGYPSDSPLEFYGIRHKIQMGPISPVTTEVLEGQSLEDITKLLNEWVPEGNIFSPSAEGLGRNITNVAAKRPAEFADVVSDLCSPNSTPVYACSILDGLQQAAQHGEPFAWNKVVSAVEQLVEAWKTGSIPLADPKNSWEATRDDVFCSALRLIEQGLEGGVFDDALENKVFDILSELSFHDDPSTEEETNRVGITKDILNYALNSVSGKALNILLRRYLQSDDEFKQKYRDKVRKLILALLAPEKRRMSSHAVIGFLYTALYLDNPSWCTQIMDTVFPEDEPRLMYAALEAHLLGHYHPKLYKHLRPAYLRLASDLPSNSPYSKFHDEGPYANLAKTVLNAFILGEESFDGELFTNVFEKASIDQKKAAIFDMAFMPSEPPDKVKEQLRQFWENRIQANDSAELQAFGSWVRPELFEPQWLLAKIDKTLELTRGVINEPYFLVLPNVAKLADHDPMLAVSIATRIVHASAIEVLHVMCDDLKKIITIGISTANHVLKQSTEALQDYLLSVGIDIA